MPGPRGNGASVLRIIPYSAIHFGVYEYYRHLLVAAQLRAAGLAATAAARRQSPRLAVCGPAGRLRRGCDGRYDHVSA